MREAKNGPLVLDLRYLDNYRVQGSTRNVNIIQRGKKIFLPIIPSLYY